MLQTFPYWLILVLYFCLRKIILDDFIGGYPDNLCHQSIGGWYHGIVNIFVPINSAVFDNHGLISVIFQTFLFILIVMTIMATFRTEGNKKRIILFSIIWFLLTLIPNYKIFPSYMNSGVGSRLAYLSTLPLSIFLTFGLSKFSSTKNLSRIIQLFAIAVFFLFGMLLYANNIIWAEAGHWTNKVVSELQQLKTSGDPLVYVAGLPDCSKYGIPCIGALQWLTAKPILDRNLVNCLRVEDEHYISADSIKEAVRKNRPGLTPLYWNSQTSKLEPVLTHIDDRLTKKWQGDNLRRLTHIFFIPVNTRHSTDWANDGTLTLTSDCKGNGFITLCFETVNIPCLDVDFFALKIKSPFFKSNSHLNASLLFTNNIIKDHCNCSDMAYASIKPTAEEQEIIFSLKNMSKWSMGGKCTQIKIVLPAVQSISIKGLRIPETRDLVPSVYFHEFDYDRPGQL